MVKIKKNKKYENTHGNGGDPANISNPLQIIFQTNNDYNAHLVLNTQFIHHMYHVYFILTLNIKNNNDANMMQKKITTDL